MWVHKRLKLCVVGKYRMKSISKQIKKCTNCKYVDKHLGDDRYHKCILFPRETYVDKTTYSYCSTARKFMHMCGPTGKMYANLNSSRPRDDDVSRFF
jgi:hypothetical protein